MPSLPSSLALTTIQTNAQILSADHRNNYAAIQVAVNALITALSGGSASQQLRALTASSLGYVTPARTQSTVGAPTGTTSTAAFVMLGLAGTITPTSSGVVVVTVDGTCQSSIGGDGGTWALAFGTGAAPANGAAAAGTTNGPAPRAVFSAANSPDPFCITRVITGLSVGTAYWLDLQFEAITGGTFSFGQVNVAAFEL